jgi:hypothetical protein
MMSSWVAFDSGRSIGKISPEGGVILRDEEHTKRVRITLKRGSGYISVSSNIYGRMDHTRFFVTIAEAQREYILMKSSLGNMIENILSTNPKEVHVWEAISQFVRRFP